jgi:anti-sigma B factor antagonist
MLAHAEPALARQRMLVAPFPGPAGMISLGKKVSCEERAQGIGSGGWVGAGRISGGPMQLKLNNRIVKGVTIVDCNGRIVFGEESALLRDTLKKVITENSQIVLNLGGISYIDSGGLGTLVALYTTAHNAGGAVKLANLTQRVGDLLQVTKLLTVFEVYDSEEKAIQSFGKGVAA